MQHFECFDYVSDGLSFSYMLQRVLDNGHFLQVYDSLRVLNKYSRYYRRTEFLTGIFFIFGDVITYDCEYLAIRDLAILTFGPKALDLKLRFSMLLTFLNFGMINIVLFLLYILRNGSGPKKKSI